MRMTPIGGLVVAGLISGCSDAGGVKIDAPLEESRIDPKAMTPVVNGAGITVTTDNWEKAGDVVDCVSRAVATTKPGLRVVPAKSFPNSIYRWDASDITELQHLMEKPAAKGEIAAGDVRYVVVIGLDTFNTDATSTSPCVFTCGKRSNGMAKIWDLSAGSEIARATATSSADAVKPIPFFGPLFPLWFDPATETAVCEGLGKRLADYFAGAAPHAAP